MSQKDLAVEFNTTTGNISWRLNRLRAKEKPEDVNAIIAEFCGTPDPPEPQPDYTDSLLETLREAEEFRETFYFGDPEPPKSQQPVKVKTIFDEAHRMLWNLEASVKRNGNTTTRLDIKGDAEMICAKTWDEDGNQVYLVKKIPLTGTAIPASGDA